ncbi:hypothetical protein HRbin10_01886 [bacterium HR10]|nr:hypothetical protein HRbin10_01886 [bacterium HR10]
MRKRRIISFVFLVGMVVGVGLRGASAQEVASPTTDLILFFSNADVPNSAQQSAPDTLIVTERSGEVRMRTWIDADQTVKSTLEIPRTPVNATLTLTVKLISISEFAIKGVIQFEDAQRSRLEFESVGTGSFSEEAVIIGGKPFTFGGYVARITRATGQFEGMTGSLTDNFWLDVSGGTLDRAIGYQFMVIRLTKR